MTSSEHADLPTTALAILGLLSFHAQSGYDLKQFADRSIRHFYWSPAKSQVYAELRRLRSLDLVEESFVEQESRPDKRVYTITPPGRQVLANWLNNSAFEPAVYKSSMLMKIFFGSSADPEALARQLDASIQHDREFLALMEEAASQCEASDDEAATFTLLTVRAGLAHGQADIKWAEEARETLLSIARNRQEKL